MSSSGPIREGVIAINKPSGISSAQVIRDVQEQFNPSHFFRPWIEREQAKKDAESRNQKQKRRWRGKRDTSVKMGHGGTLDPMATGVLILGLGSGTKALQHFMTECTKTYEAVVLFGAATDSYDTEGKIVGRKPFGHITKEMVEEALEKFRGKGMQKPPIFSALRVNGKRLYEYARAGEEIPVEIKERPVEVSELVMTEWMEGGTHVWHWPAKEAEIEEKIVAKKALDIGSDGEDAAVAEATESEASAKRKRNDDAEEAEPASKKAKENTAATEDAPEQATSNEATNEKAQSKEPGGEEADTAKAEPETEALDQSATERPPCAAPACRVRMRVTSGFYVRSLCHDLGAAVGSLGLMASLVRIQQGDFELGKNVLQYEEVKQGEDVWAPKVEELLADWENKSKN